MNNDREFLLLQTYRHFLFMMRIYGPLILLCPSESDNKLSNLGFLIQSQKYKIIHFSYYQLQNSNQNNIWVNTFVYFKIKRFIFI